jgi:hypothetical protein
MPSAFVISEPLEPRTLLSSAVIGHIDTAAARSHAASTAIAVKLKHAKHRANAARHAAAAATSAGIGSLSVSGPFSFTFGDFVFSGTIDGSTHAVNATLVGPGVQFDVVGSFDASTGQFQGTITGDRTNLAISGTLNSRSVKGSLNGILFGNAISFNRTIIL